MNTKNMTQEQISAFSDGEADNQLDMVLEALRERDGQATWDVYHHIGDVLRSDEMAFAMRPDFAARMAARLEAEPTVIAPAVRQALVRRQAITSDEAAVSVHPLSSRHLTRFAMAGAAAAVAAIALVTAPQMMVALNGGASGPGKPLNVATVTKSAPLNPAIIVAAPSEVVAVNLREGVVLRDPRIDDYLLAHQRFSPSVYSTAQYARSAAFSTEQNK